MSAPVRVLWLAKGLRLGGAERLLSLASRHVDSDQFRIEVAYLLPWKTAFVKDLQSYGIQVHCVGADRIADPRWVARLRTLVRQRCYQIVHTHSPLPATAVRLLVGPRRPRLVHTEHNLWGRYRPLTRGLNAATFWRNDAVIAVSAGVAASIRRPDWFPLLPLPPVEVIHHGIDPDMVRRGDAARDAARVRLGLGRDDLVLGTVGNFTAKKDHATLLRSVDRLRRVHPGLRLILIGGGPLETQLRQQARQTGLDDCVVFAGARDDVQDLLPAFDVYVMTSVHEGLPIALVEAMAAGLPCVVTAVGGIPEIATDGQEGLLVPPGDPVAHAEAVDKLLRDPLLRSEMGSAAAATAARFSIEAAVRRIEACYRTVLADR